MVQAKSTSEPHRFNISYESQKLSINRKHLNHELKTINQQDWVYLIVALKARKIKSNKKEISFQLP